MFVPDGFEPPRGLAVDRFRLEPLGPEHNDRDYAAWSTSIEHIRRSPGFENHTWPHPMSLDENLADIERHAVEFEARAGFAYTVLDDDDDVVGCVYLYPARDRRHDALVTSWVRASRTNLDSPLREAVAAWLASDWPFERPLYAPLLGSFKS